MQEVNLKNSDFKVKQLKETKRNILLLLLTLLFCFLIFEFALRIFSYPVYGFQKGAFVSDDILGYKLSSNYSGVQSIYGRTAEINTNSKGMRDFREYNYAKENGKYRILILGDSYSFGNGVNLNESYSEYLRENFKDKNVEVINLAVPGYGISHEYMAFLEEGKKYTPDIILIQFSPNDWGIDQVIEKNEQMIVNKNQSAIANKDGFLVSPKEGTIRSIHLSLLWNFRTYGFFYTKMRSLFSKIVANYWKEKQGTPYYFLDINSEQYQNYYKGYFSLVEKLKNSTNATVMLFAGPFGVYYVSPEDVKKEYNLDYEINPAQTKESVKEIAKKLNLSFIELDTNDQTIYLPVDGHLNSKGNKIVADKLYLELSF